MADLHTAEAVVEMNRAQYPTDSVKRAFMQAVFIRHNVTSEQFDKSQEYYGHHLDKYMEIYDNTITILDQRLTAAGNRVSAEAALSIAGDSVDVWPHSRTIRLSPLNPTSTLTFDFSYDENWEAGDSYTWRAKLLNVQAQGLWTIATEYSNGQLETSQSKVSGDGWREIIIQTDSTLTPVRIYGTITISTYPRISPISESASAIPLRDVVPSFLDSVQVIRKRVNKNTYHQRSRQKRITNYTSPVEIPDSTTTDSIQ